MTTSTAEHHSKILAFLTSTFTLRDHKACVMVELVYAPPTGYSTTQIRMMDPATHPELFAPERSMVLVGRLAAEILDIAEDHADSFGAGEHRYTIRAHQSMGGRPIHSFRLLPAFNGADDGTALVASGGAGGAVGTVTLAEQPTAQGLTGQLMRHLEMKERGMERMFALALQASNHHASALRDENTELRQIIAKKDGERLEWQREIEEARSNAHQREIEAHVVTQEQERKTLVTKRITSMLPVLLSKALGSGKTKAGETAAPPSPLARIVRALAESMSDDQKEAIGALLTVEQQIAFSQIVEVAENGDSVLLPQMLSDLFGGLDQQQQIGIMGTLNGEQRQMFLEAAKLAATKTSAPGETSVGDQATK